LVFFGGAGTLSFPCSVSQGVVTFAWRVVGKVTKKMVLSIVNKLQYFTDTDNVEDAQI
jgi:hypothetical protein